MFKTKYKLFVILFIALSFLSPVKTLAMLRDSDGSDDATQVQGEKPAASDAAPKPPEKSDEPAASEKSADPAAEDSPPPPEAVFAASAEGSSDMVPPPPIDYNRQLEEILRDSAKQARIEVRVIQRLRAIDQSGAFSEIFVNALNGCDDLRTPKPMTGDPAKMVYKIPLPTNRIKEYENFDESKPIFQSALASKLGEMPWQLLENLHTPERQQLSLILIRTLNDMQNEAPSSYAMFFTRVNQLFYHSRRLLSATVCPQIIEKYGITDAQGIRFRTVQQIIPEGERNAGGDRNTQVCEFTSGGKNYACLLRKKTGGVHFGGVVDIGEIIPSDEDGLPILNPESKRTYFLKAYHGYPATESKDSGDTKLDTIRMATSTEEAPENLPVQPLDLREPFIYSMLNKLKLGPKAHFMINPYINNGFFIVTEGLSAHGEEFVELEKINDKLQANKSNPTDINTILRPLSRYPLKGKMVCDLTLASIFVNIFRLTDIKGDNIGYVAPSSLFNHLVDCSDYHQLKLMMIDFLTPHPEAAQSPIIESFLQGTFFSESNSGVRPYEPIISQCENSFRSLLPYITTFGIRRHINEFNVDAVKGAFIEFQQIAPQKVREGQVALREFQARSGQNFADILNQAKAEILSLSTSTGIPVHVVLRLDPAAGSKFSAYVDFASRNYHELENFLNRDHETWINDVIQQVQEAINAFEGSMRKAEEETT
ncbi:MAG: hypothetical protein LBI41_05585 [Lactobacillales bacterium]|nr:hypothetical protein [Lactobacillales bacterium]